VPQSELVLLDASHFMVFRAEPELVAPVMDFLGRAESGEALSRAHARSERLARAAGPLDPGLLGEARGIALFVLMNLIALATFVSEDLASIGAGLLTAQGRIGYFAACLACFVGILAGDLGLYLIGRVLGRPWLRRAPLRWWISDEAVERSRNWFAEKGPSVAFASRFMPGTRVGTYVAAGVVATPFWRFSSYLALAVMVWVPLLVGASFLLGAKVFEYFEVFRRWAIPGVLAVAILLVFGLRLLRAIGSLGTRRGRLLLKSRWRRFRHWEFWPARLFYLPVLVRVAGLAARHRSLTVFTAANPGIPAGGFLGESKSEILDQIGPEWVAPYRVIRSGSEDPVAEALEFMRERSLEFPVVVKPDIGERGRRVSIVESRGQLEDALVDVEQDYLVQEYVPGPELGVFYVRRPSDEHGSIFSITDKRLPEVIGDGRANLEALILEGARANALAPLFLRRFPDAAQVVPKAGETIRLTQVGTHCLGAMFLDGSRWKTSALEATVDRISRSFEGFYFGRYDLRAPSYEAFEQGEAIRVLELNGVTSEATHIYDPANSLGSAYKTLSRQWGLAFEIGRANRDRGVRPARMGELLKAIWRHLL
jgi:membrane protein DedA with SNARE-associated domain